VLFRSWYRIGVETGNFTSGTVELTLSYAIGSVPIAWIAGRLRGGRRTLTTWHYLKRGGSPGGAMLANPTFVSQRLSTRHVPPKVTFYRKLTQADEEPSRGEADPRDAQPQDSVRQIPPDTPKPDKSEQVAHSSSSVTAPAPASQHSDLPRASAGPAVYTVQVGAFTDPAVAQQWAQKWKARGYNVALRPVARPKTGVIYRLYLGKFSSQKKADELVQRLKHREGISAFPLVVRN